LTLLRTAPRGLAIASLLLLAASLAGCGRRGPLELPPDVQARGQQAQAEAASRTPRATGPLGEPVAPPPPAIPGTVGNRPPAAYPFFLDPLL
jgi:predicted small lipoprotein YifL